MLSCGHGETQSKQPVVYPVNWRWFRHLLSSPKEETIMRMNERMKKALSALLCVSMLAQNAPVVAFAAQEDCTHHAEHTQECGYVAAVEGKPCTHSHDTAVCGYVEEVKEELCDCTETDENGALVQMMERMNDTTPTIVIADRAYEAYNTMVHIEQKGWKYLIRMREKAGILTPFSLPMDGEMDRWMKVVLTKKWNKQVQQLAKEHPGMYRFLPTSATFDFLDSHDKVNIFYPMTFRVVRFQLTEDSWETVITNLDEDQFPPEELKKLYHRRWGIETSFRQLKHTVGLRQLQSKKVEHVIQEIFARLIMYNFSELIASHAVIQNKTGKFIYQINFSAAVHICRQFLRGSVKLYSAFRLLIPAEKNTAAFFRYLYRSRGNSYNISINQNNKEDRLCINYGKI